MLDHANEFGPRLRPRGSVREPSKVPGERQPWIELFHSLTEREVGRRRRRGSRPIHSGSRVQANARSGDASRINKTTRALARRVVLIPALTYFPGDRRPEYLRRWRA